MNLASTNTATNNVVEVKEVCLDFHTKDGVVKALSNVDLSINAGEFVSFIGPSGCGKTTLMRVLADLEKPTSGSVLVNGMSPAEARKQELMAMYSKPLHYCRGARCKTMCYCR